MNSGKRIVHVAAVKHLRLSPEYDSIDERPDQVQKGASCHGVHTDEQSGDSCLRAAYFAYHRFDVFLIAEWLSF